MNTTRTDKALLVFTALFVGALARPSVLAGNLDGFRCARMDESVP